MLTVSKLQKALAESVVVEIDDSIRFAEWFFTVARGAEHYNCEHIVQHLETRLVSHYHSDYLLYDMFPCKTISERIERIQLDTKKARRFVKGQHKKKK